MAHWPWSTDQILWSEVVTLRAKVEALTVLVKTYHKEEMHVMAKLDDKLDAVDAAQAAALARIDEDVKSFEETIAALKAAVEAGQVLTPQQEARLDAIIAVTNGIDPRKPDVLPE
jgi:hypothetical protein